MVTFSQVPATLDDLMRTEGRAELVGGRIVHLVASGMQPAAVGFTIAVSLRDFAKSTAVGQAFADGVGYTVPVLTSGRQSFQPDASYFDGPAPANRMKFIPHPPTFAVEVRSEHDYGTTADREYEAKRADYFEAGTLAVWDVDTQAETVRLFLPASAAVPAAVFRRGQLADAGLAVPGWSVMVDDVFA